MAGRTQTTRATNQDRTSASAESSIAQAPASQVAVVVEGAVCFWRHHDGERSVTPTQYWTAN